jgi:hypothetical protein
LAQQLVINQNYDRETKIMAMDNETNTIAKHKTGVAISNT